MSRGHLNDYSKVDDMLKSLAGRNINGALQALSNTSGISKQSLINRRRYLGVTTKRQTWTNNLDDELRESLNKIAAEYHVAVNTLLDVGHSIMQNKTWIRPHKWTPERRQAVMGDLTALANRLGASVGAILARGHLLLY